MKKTYLLIGGLCVSAALSAQGLPEAKQLLYHERYESAKAALHRVLKADASNAEAWYLLSQAYLPLKQVQKLSDTLPLAPATVQAQPIYKVAYGQLLLAQQKGEEAKRQFDQAIGDGRKKEADILLAVANAYVSGKNGDANAALLVLSQAGKKEIETPAFNVVRGNAYRKLANGTEAYRAYQAALNEDSKNAEALFQMGKIFVAQKNADSYIEYFNKTLAADPLYAPALYELYYDAYFKDGAKALDYFRQYLAVSDHSPENQYQLIDLLYINKQFDSAIVLAQGTLAALPADSMPRLHKLMAYSYAGMTDTAKALNAMKTYFANAHDSAIAVKDYELMANLYNATPGMEDSALVFYQEAVSKVTDAAALYTYYKKLSELYKERKDPANEAIWLGRYYAGNEKATNLDLFNWGIAHVRAEQYEQADTVFGAYIGKYPEQSFGYYWRARANSMRDSAMEKGLAIPHYNTLVDVLEKDSANATATTNKWLVEAYGYIAAYETNQEKDYADAIGHLQKVLEIDPANKDAQSYITILEKKLSADSKDKDKERANNK